MIVKRVGKLAPSNPVSASGKARGLRAGALDALQARAQAKGAIATAGNDVDEWKEGINSRRLLTWAELLKIADERGYPKTWAEAFYRRSSDDEKKGAEDPATPTPAGPQVKT